MLGFYWSTLTMEDKVAYISLAVIFILLIGWLVLSNTRFGERTEIVEFEARIWRKHGVSVTGLFVVLLVIIVILYGVWLLLGEF